MDLVPDRRIFSKQKQNPRSAGHLTQSPVSGGTDLCVSVPTPDKEEALNIIC